jgi:hypothetical protein
MRTRIAALTAVAVLTLGVAACSEPEQENAEATTEEAGASLQEEAAQVGSAIAAGAGEVAQEIDEGTDQLAVKAEEQKAETKTDEKGNQP